MKGMGIEDRGAKDLTQFKVSFEQGRIVLANNSVGQLWLSKAARLRNDAKKMT